MRKFAHFYLAIVLSMHLLIASNSYATERVTINHLNWDPSRFDLATLDAVRSKRIIFIHASVGSNIAAGLMTLKEEDPIRYNLNITHAPVDPDRLDEPAFGHEHFTKLSGYVEGTTDKTTPKTVAFDSLIRSPDGNGVYWGNAVDIAFYKYCWVDIRRYDYIDPTSIFNYYITNMEVLSKDFPTCKFIHFTCPIKGNMDNDFEKLDNIKRHQYNELVRAYVDTAGGYLFDIADIESYDDQGIVQTFEYGGSTYPKMWYIADDPDNDGWSSDGGHLNAKGQERVALAMWSLWAQIQSDLLPVELATFTGRYNNKNRSVELHWQTFIESNNYGFEIQRAKGQNSFETIAFIKGQGYSVSEHSYQFVDKGVSPGVYQYRLKQIDLDGHFEYSETIQITISLPHGLYLFQNYPNPFNSSTTIAYSVPIRCHVRLSIHNIFGQSIFKAIDEYKDAGNYTIRLSPDQFAGLSLPSGTYYYRLEALNITKQAKMIYLK